MKDIMDRILVVDCSEETQIQRLMARDGESREQACRIMATQASREQRLEMPTVRPRRVDLLPTGALILESLLEQLGIEELTVSDWGLREGVLLE